MCTIGCEKTKERDMTKKKEITGYYGYYDSKKKRRVLKVLYKKI
ncbi:MAG: hypothetical protein RL736_266 [Pseudomonadota bacterium]